jgi:hypothetical protein
MSKLFEILRTLAILGLIGFCPSFTSAQATDPLAGTWNFKVLVTSGCSSECNYSGMLAFSQGGTVVEQRGTVIEYGGLGDIERTALGRWRPANAMLSYTFKMKNFVFDSNGELSGYVIASSAITLSSTHNSLTGKGTANIFHANDKIATESFTISGTRF